jgi:hypothetical protein
MLKTLSLVTVGATMMALGTVAQAEAASIIQPQSVSTDLGVSSTFFDLDRAIDQSGLTATYTSGVTDFASYLSGNPEHDFLGNSYYSKDSAPGSVTFDLGNVFDLDGMAMWGTSSLFTARNFDLFASETGNDGSFVGLGSFLQDYETGLDTAQVFDFAPTTAQFIRMDIKDSYLNTNRAGIGEVAFRAAAATPEPESVPEPATIFGLLTTLGLGALSAKKTSKNAEGK